MDFVSTVKGSLLEGFYPKGWDMKKIDKCCSNKPEDVCKRQKFWNKGFEPVQCNDLVEFEVKMGHEIASEICNAKAAGQNGEGVRGKSARSASVCGVQRSVLTVTPRAGSAVAKAYSSSKRGPSRARSRASNSVGNCIFSSIMYIPHRGRVS